MSPAPFTELIAAYPFGTQISLGVSPDGSRVYVAEGGAIDILNTSNSPPNTPTSIDQIELPETSPYSILHYNYPSNQKRLLFIAGGTSGLWMAVMCPELFAALPPQYQQACPCNVDDCDRWERTHIDIAEYPGVVRKRCVDVAVVTGNVTAGVPLLCAIYTARSDSPAGPSELRVYKVLPDYSVVHHAVVNLPGPAQHADAAATALVVDPADPNSVYVALGTAWLYRVDLLTLTAAPFLPGQSPSTVPPDQMRDLAVVRTATRGTFIYASLDYGRILEYALLPGTVSQTALDCSFADRIAAVTDGGDKVLVGVVLQKLNGRSQDSGWRPGHLWYEECLGVGIPDPNVPANYCDSPGACCSQVRFYRRDTSQTGSQLSLILTAPHNKTVWGTLELRRISPTLVRSYECNLYIGTTLREIDHPFSTPTPGDVNVYIGPGNGSGDGPVSLRNPGLPHFGGEVRGTVVAKRLYITPPPARIRTMENIECPRPTIQPGSDCGSISPFGGTLFGEANWLASDGVGEWFFTGTRTWLQTNDQCVGVNFPADCYDDSCGTGASRFWDQGAFPGAYGNQVGWHLIYMKPAGNPPTWDTLDLRWYQIASPTVHDEDKSPTNDLLTSQADPRTVPEVDWSVLDGVFAGTPVLIHCVRSGSHWGYKVFRTADLLAARRQTCPPVAGATLRGIGEPLLGVRYHELLTHLEILNGGCADNDHCDTSGLDTARGFINTKCHIFPVTRSSGEVRWVTVVTAGTVVTRDESCAWYPFRRKPMVVFYDVTDTAQPSFPAPVLLRVGIGSDAGGDGNAWAAHSKTYASGQTYVFVADLQGKLMVFDVTGDKLFDPVAPSVYPPQTLGLRPIATMEFPRDPYDAYPPNVIDVEIDGEFAYCALGRSGVGIVDISIPQMPILLEILETSGYTEGIAFRTDELGRKQMLGGDFGAGMRVWGRPGE